MSNKEYRMSKDNKTFDLEDRLIDFAVRIIQVAESFWADLRWHLSVGVNATIIIPYLNTLHGRRVLDIHTLAVD